MTMQNFSLRFSQLKRSYGTAYLLSWVHRLAGIGLVLFLGVHIYTLSQLATPELFDLKMAWLRQTGLYHLEWILALPVIFHALNGGRLVLYEVFGNRRDDMLVTWVTGLAGMYVLVLMLMMYMSGLTLGASWLYAALVIGLAIMGTVIFALRKTKIGIYWKLQRISGALLLVMIPVHMAYMHANPSAGHDSAVILSRLRGDFLIRTADLLMVLSVLYHGAYGLMSIARDYLESAFQVRCLAVMITLLAAAFGWLGIKTIVMV